MTQRIHLEIWLTHILCATFLINIPFVFLNCDHSHNTDWWSNNNHLFHAHSTTTVKRMKNSTGFIFIWKFPLFILLAHLDLIRIPLSFFIFIHFHWECFTEFFHFYDFVWNSMAYIHIAITCISFVPIPAHR